MIAIADEIGEYDDGCFSLRNVIEAGEKPVDCAVVGDVEGAYNIFYSIGMLSTAALASAAARLLNFWGVLLCTSAILLLFIPFLLKAGPSRGVVTAASGG